MASYLRMLLCLTAAVGCIGSHYAEEDVYDESILCLDQGVPSEIVVVVDRSFSISPAQFRLLQGFTKSLASRLLDRAGAEQRMAIVSYAEGATVACDLRQCTTAATVHRHVDALNNRQYGALTKTMDGLRAARDVLKHRRPSARVFVILFTDGVSNDGTPTATAKTLQEASVLRQMPNVTLVAVGIGRDINRAELEGAATRGAENVFTVDSFHQLNKQLIDELFRKACIKTTNPCEFSRRHADVVFVPMTQHLSPVNGRLVLQMARAFAESNEVRLGGGRVRVGVVPQRCQLDVGYSLDTAPSDLSRVTDERLGRSFLTATDYMKEATDSYTPRPDRQPLDAKIAVLVVDQHLNRRDSALVLDAARKLRASGVTTLAIGVGASYDKELTAALASAPRLHFSVGDYTDLFNLDRSGKLLVQGSPFEHLFSILSKESCMQKKKGLN